MQNSLLSWFFRLTSRLSSVLPPSDSSTSVKVRPPLRRTSLSHNQNSNGSTKVVSKVASFSERSLNQPITFTQYCLHYTIRYGYSANPSRAHRLPHTSCRLDVCFEIEWLDWFFSQKAFNISKKTNKKKKANGKKKNNVSTDTTENQVMYVQRTLLWFKSV